MSRAFEDQARAPVAVIAECRPRPRRRRPLNFDAPPVAIRTAIAAGRDAGVRRRPEVGSPPAGAVTQVETHP